VARKVPHEMLRHAFNYFCISFQITYNKDLCNNVPPPSEDVILKIAAALYVDKKELLIVAQKMDPEISSYVAQDAEAADFLRMAREKKFDSNDWDTLTKLAEAAKLGKPKKLK
jgi:hypothetical protein